MKIQRDNQQNMLLWRQIERERESYSISIDFVLLFEFACLNIKITSFVLLSRRVTIEMRFVRVFVAVKLGVSGSFNSPASHCCSLHMDIDGSHIWWYKVQLNVYDLALIMKTSRCCSKLTASTGILMDSTFIWMAKISLLDSFFFFFFNLFQTAQVRNKISSNGSFGRAYSLTRDVLCWRITTNVCSYK